MLTVLVSALQWTVGMNMFVCNDFVARCTQTALESLQHILRFKIVVTIPSC